MNKIFYILIIFLASLYSTDNYSMDHALYKAMRKNDLEECKELISKGAKINYRDKDGNTLLHHAVHFNDADLTRLLLTNGANINAKNNYDNAPLHWALIFEYKDIAKLLLDNGADINAKGNLFASPLHYAVSWEQSSIVKFLIDEGADVNITDSDGNTVFDIAEKKCHPEMVSIIGTMLSRDHVKKRHVKKSVKLIKKFTRLALDFKDKKGESLLHIIVANASIEIIKNILSLTYGLSGVKNKAGQTPIMLAAQKGPEFLNIFRQLIIPQEN